jgi:hypothetical protein
VSISAAEDGRVVAMEGMRRRWAPPCEWVEDGTAVVDVEPPPPPPVELEGMKYWSGVEYTKRFKSVKANKQAEDEHTGGDGMYQRKYCSRPGYSQI